MTEHSGTAAAKLGRPRRVEDDVVFAAMATVLMRVGLARLNVNLVAEEVGVTPAALRQRFGSKRELLAAFHAWGTRQIREISAGQPAPDGSALDALREMIRESVAFVTTPAQIANSMSVFTEVGEDPDLRRVLDERFTLAIDRSTALLDHALYHGEIEGADAAVLARQLHYCLLGASVAWSVSGRRPIGDELVDAADQLLAPYRPGYRT
ncbi:TetR/AcrR family transcriptional regulator [Nocardia australiensis]|uniref:TetR/AcrR family transcriptional regulator n=1 Tax=Nocardia australiensis TaxID=2887191 RepID=UPI001D14B3F6|nr:TetR/AcrR family transcriptional regulator [Nocardia australiensis]